MNGRLFGSKSDVLAAVGVITVIIALLVIWLSGVRSDRPDDSNDTIQLNEEQRNAVDSTVKTFISTAGTFGFDWQDIDDPSPDGTNLRNVTNQWLQYSADPSGYSIPAELATHIKTRDTALASLTKPVNDGPPVLAPSNGLNKSGFEYVTLSDALYASRFTTDASDVKTNWNGSRTRTNGSAIETNIKVSWLTKWTRATNIPTGDDQGLQFIPSRNWDPQTTSERFKDVRMTLVSTDDGKHWNVTSISDGGNNDLSKYGFMLATGDDFKYDQNGVLLNGAERDGSN